MSYDIYSTIKYCVIILKLYKYNISLFLFICAKISEGGWFSLVGLGNTEEMMQHDVFTRTNSCQCIYSSVLCSTLHYILCSDGTRVIYLLLQETNLQYELGSCNVVVHHVQHVNDSCIMIPDD